MNPSIPYPWETRMTPSQSAICTDPDPSFYPMLLISDGKHIMTIEDAHGSRSVSLSDHPSLDSWKQACLSMIDGTIPSDPKDSPMGTLLSVVINGEEESILGERDLASHRWQYSLLSSYGIEWEDTDLPRILFLFRSLVSQRIREMQIQDYAMDL